MFLTRLTFKRHVAGLLPVTLAPRLQSTNPSGTLRLDEKGTSSFLFLVGPGAPSSVLAPCSDARSPFQLLVPNGFLFLVGPGAPSSVLAPSSDARSS